MKYQAAKGVKDILPGEISAWRWLENCAAQVFPLYNFAPIRTPIFEATDLFVRSIGETSDIVGKEMYTFTDKGERSLTLRPEGTACVIRAWLENNLSQASYDKLYYQGPMFRQERPQAGRLRQFHQIGAEWFGCAHPSADALMIAMGLKYLEAIGLADFQVLVASVGCQECRPSLNQKIKENLKAALPHLCADCQKRYEKNPLRILDCKNPDCQKYVAQLPPLTEALCQACQDHFKEVQKYLTLSGIKFVVSHQLVRGLDYYTRTTFEIISADLGAQNSLCGGGRYDYLVKELGGPDTPAVGLAFGLERLLMVLEKRPTPKIPSSPQPLVWLAALGEAAYDKLFSLSAILRQNNIRVDLEPGGGTFKSQLRSADRQKAAAAVIAGDQELAKGVYLVKNMANSAQKEVPEAGIIDDLKEFLRS